MDHNNSDIHISAVDERLVCGGDEGGNPVKVVGHLQGRLELLALHAANHIWCDATLVSDVVRKRIGRYLFRVRLVYGEREETEVQK